MRYASKIKKINRDISDLRKQKVDKDFRWLAPEKESAYIEYHQLRDRISQVCEPFVDDRCRIDSTSEQYYVYSDFELSDLYDGLLRIKKKLAKSRDNVSEAQYYETLLQAFAEEKIDSELLALENFIKETNYELSQNGQVNSARTAYQQACQANSDELLSLKSEYERSMHELILRLQESGKEKLLLAQQAVQAGYRIYF